MCIVDVVIYSVATMLFALGAAFVFLHQKYLGVARNAEAVGRRSRDIGLSIQDVYEARGSLTVTHFDVEAKWMAGEAKEFRQRQRHSYLGRDWKLLMYLLGNVASKVEGESKLVVRLLEKNPASDLTKTGALGGHIRNAYDACMRESLLAEELARHCRDFAGMYIARAAASFALGSFLVAIFASFVAT